MFDILKIVGLLIFGCHIQYMEDGVKKILIKSRILFISIKHDKHSHKKSKYIYKIGKPFKN